MDIQGAAIARRERRQKRIFTDSQFKQLTEKRKSLQRASSNASSISSQSALSYSTSTDSIYVGSNEYKAPRIYEELQDKYAQQTLLVIKGKIPRETPDFESFKRTNNEIWNRIETVLNRIEAYCDKFGIQFAEVNGRKLSEAALLNVITDDNIYECLNGIDELVEQKKSYAAYTIQKCIRKYLENMERKKRKEIFKAAFTIQNFWRNLNVNKRFRAEIRSRLRTVSNRAEQLQNLLRGKYKEIEKAPYLIVHVITGLQDLTRCFDLMFKNVTLILLLPSLPSEHVWEEMLDLFSQSGIDDTNSRIHFVVLRQNSSVSQQLLRDMKSIQQVRKIICGRDAFLIPHQDWSIESTISVDINLPILGCIDPTSFQRRSVIKSLFREAGIVPLISTKEHQDLSALLDDTQDLIEDNDDIKVWIIRLSYSTPKTGVAWFDAKDFRDLKKIHSSISSNNFISQIKQLGATIEAIPPNIRSFPSVSLLLTGNEIRVIGTFDRIHHSPFSFSSILIPSISVDGTHLIGLSRQVGSVLMRKGVLGYVIIDFLSYVEENEIRLIGYDIRLNSYPNSLYTAYFTLCAGFDSQRNKMLLLNNIKTTEKTFKRFAIVQSQISHPGLAMMSINETKQCLFNKGFMFDLLNRVGFRIQFFGAPYEGKGLAICAATSANVALQRMIKIYEELLKILGKKAGCDGESSIAKALIGLRNYKERVFM
ncbi:IQ calmodulin-binding motif family protein [Histomonas meleagridis]|uniref:IQ calmodulin-binding motif family protein n=1 Tax=Histomonas meleagridis TaxID=135588 RepID=UPI0035598762|nr:IQ calmodulin-binding motif family protein [Histomonas meleagridis]KAH0799976.1 IQ calmodulin-binding motif family protein [Histomonas meleagridis]